MTRVLVTAKIPQSAFDILKHAELNIEMYSGDGVISKDELIKRIAGKDYLITPLSTIVDKDVINADPELKLIANFGAGFNNIDAKYAREKNIPVTNTPQVSTVSTAEVTTGLIISLSHRIVEGDKLMRTKGFAGWAPLFFLGHELAGKTLGIFGMGQIGQAVAKRMAAFDMNIIYNQRHALPADIETNLNAKFVSLDELIKNSDVLTIHAPLTPETTHTFGTEQFRQMKKTAIIINAARGPLIDENDLLKALENNELAGAALDVYEHEPDVNDGFKELDNVILTPHIGNATIEARNAMANIVAKNVVLVNDGKDPLYIVN
ncbi:2-hydroxyacid dehydrogenase family protein [Companilactobacillus nuruki]|uniref:Hydroxyacid dehydrogenase n=1 Tax=Companilactobacillus nuruki TaxID=1993540 RepID=A0A2N7AVV2_9LACO|nr:2-hydroxyacid dehydrogenase family protein [Companilactobacillus nuruki]PMD72299.1 hydroxyacid dehydrogenase [Companilactobacillus nuruki]